MPGPSMGGLKCPHMDSTLFGPDDLNAPCDVAQGLANVVQVGVSSTQRRRTRMPRQIPKPVEELWKRYPAVWKAFNELGSRCHEAGPLDEKSRRLVKLALSIGAGLEGATHSAVRNAQSVAIPQQETDHVAQLAVSTLGMPAATRAFTGSATTRRTTRSGLS